VRPGDNFTSKVTQFFTKVDVNGVDEIPLYTYLKESCEPTFSTFSYTHNLFYEPLAIGDIAWNFEKFLIGRDGKPMFRYHPHLIDPDHIEMNKDIDSAHKLENPFAEEQLQKSLDEQFPIVTQKPLEPSASKIVVNEARGL